jgi:hypothetical protein
MHQILVHSIIFIEIWTHAAVYITAYQLQFSSESCSLDYNSWVQCYRTALRHGDIYLMDILNKTFQIYAKWFRFRNPYWLHAEWHIFLRVVCFKALSASVSVALIMRVATGQLIGQEVEGRHYLGIRLAVKTVKKGWYSLPQPKFEPGTSETNVCSLTAGATLIGRII